MGKVSGSGGTEFGRRLFGDLYEVASAYVLRIADGEGEMRLFDTIFARQALKRSWPDGDEVALYSNQPEGKLSTAEGDLKNLALMPSGTHLFIVCEDKCVEWNSVWKKTE